MPVRHRVVGFVLFALAIAGETSWAAAPPPPKPVENSAVTATLADTAAALQKTLKATDEEWSVILPKLQEIEALRDELHAAAAPAPPRMGGQFDSPLGGTSMDAPTMS